MDQTPPNPPPPLGDALQPEVAQSKGKRTYPIGVILILVYEGLVILQWISSLLFAKHIAMFGPVIVTGTPATLYNLVLLGALMVLFVGLIRLKPWGRVMGMALHGYEIVEGLFFLLSVVLWPHEMKEALVQFFPGFGASPAFAIIIISALLFVMSSIALTIVLYLFLKKEYFKS